MGHEIMLDLSAFSQPICKGLQSVLELASETLRNMIIVNYGLNF
jgi:hypothetical protein